MARTEGQRADLMVARTEGRSEDPKGGLKVDPKGGQMEGRSEVLREGQRADP